MTGGYPFATGNPLQTRFSYAYVPFTGEAFLDGWRAARDQVRTELVARAAEPGAVLPATTLSELDELDRERDAASRHLLDQRLRRFETTGKAAGPGRPPQIRSYIDLAATAVRRYRDTEPLTALNVLIKALDVICASAAELSPDEAAAVVVLLDAEQQFVDQLRTTS